MAQYSTYTEFEVVALMNQGDKKAFEEIYSRYSGLLFKHGYKKLADRDDTMEVVQKVFIQLWDNHSVLVPGSNLVGYLYTALQRKILDFFKHKRMVGRNLQALQQIINKWTEGSDYLVREKQLMDIIEKEIAALPPKMREVFELSRYQHLSHKQIAEQLNISEETSKKQVKNSLSILRKKLGLMAYMVFLLKF